MARQKTSLFAGAAVAASLAIGLGALSFVPLIAGAANATASLSNVTISDPISGSHTAPFSFDCNTHPLYNPVTISGTAVASAPPGNLDQYHVSVDWGDGTISDSVEASSFGTGHGTSTRAFSATHSYTTNGSHPIVTTIYHVNGGNSNDNTIDATFTVNTCVFVPAPNTGALLVTKTVVGGSKQPGDFTLHVTNASSSPGSFNPTTGTTTVTLTPGAYSISETADSSYIPSYSDDCSGSVAAGETRVCHVTNTFNSAPQPVTFTLTYTAGTGGSISGTSPQTVNDGADGIAVTALANSGFHFTGWSDGSTTPARTDTHVTGNVSVTANFAENPPSPTPTHTLTYGVGTCSSISGAANQTVDEGTNGSAVEALPGANSHFVSWSDASTTNPRTDTNVTTNISVTASCEANTPTPATGATVVIVKHAIHGADGTFTFNGLGEAVNVTTVGGWGTTTVAVNEGSYSLTESAQAGWAFSGVSCLYENESVGNVIQNGEFITPDAGDTVTCTFTNRATQADLVMAKAADVSTVAPGGTVHYTLTVHNNGPANISGVAVSDVIPAGESFVGAEGDGSYDATSGAWSISSIAAGATATLTITVTVNADTTGEVVNSASVSFNDESVRDPEADNNSASSSITVSVTTHEEPRHGGGGGGGGGGCGAGFAWSPSLTKCVPVGQVLGAATSAPALGVTCGLYMDQHLRMGSSKNRPDQVTKLQQFLVKHGFGSFTTTGFFGPKTLAAVNAFQRANKDQILTPWHLSGPTGLAYLTTIRQLNLIECPDLMIPQPELVPWNENPNAQ